MKRFVLFVLFSLTFLASSIVSAATFRPEITNEPLINPGMGLVNFHYSNRPWAYGSQVNGERVVGDTLDWFPGCSTIYFRLPWAILEPEEGVFRWDLIDSWAQPWIQSGKQIAFRITCSENRWTYATPKWVRDAGAKGTEYVWPVNDPEIPNGQTLWEPDFLDPVFLEKFDHFLAAFAKKYGGKPYVAFIDIGSIGMWGEGHTGRSSKLTKEQTFEVVKAHVQLHKKHFPTTLLVISDDVAGTNLPRPHFPATDYALENGVSLRDDSIMTASSGKPWYHAEMAGLFWPTMPVVVETEHYGLAEPRGNWSEQTLEDSVEAYHASFLSIHWFAQDYLEKNRAAIERINLRLGYRLELREVKFPESVRMDEPFQIETLWANVGVAPCYGGGNVIFTLLNEEGKVAWVSTDESFNVRDLPTAEPGKAPEVRRASMVRIGWVDQIAEMNDGVIVNLKRMDQWPYADGKVPMLKPGKYTLCVSVGDADGTPKIALPLKNQIGERRYKVGEIEVE